MFFLLSKTLGVVLLPSNLIIAVGVVGLLLLLTRFVALGRRLVVACVMLMVVCGFSPIGKWLLFPLESRFPPWDDSRGAPDGVVVLGGAIEPDISAAHGAAVFGPSIGRVIAAAELAHRYPNVRVVFTGGNARLGASDAAGEADFALPVLEGFGLSRDRLIMERRSRNTAENAAFSKAMVTPKTGERWLLVTSAYHIPRAVGIFRKAGFAVEPYPVDWRVGGREDLFRFTRSLVGGMARVDTAAREWMGLIAYRISGKTSEFLPGPAPH